MVILRQPDPSRCHARRTTIVDRRCYWPACPPRPATSPRVVLALTVCAMLSGARSCAAIGEWAADGNEETLALLGVGRFPPGESAFRQIVGRLNSGWSDAAAFGVCTAARNTPTACRRRIAVDGKILRGSGQRTGPGRHLLAALDHTRGITDLAASQIGPADLADTIRGYWHIENRLHWIRYFTPSSPANQQKFRSPAVGPELRSGPTALQLTQREITSCRRRVQMSIAKNSQIPCSSDRLRCTLSIPPFLYSSRRAGDDFLCDSQPPPSVHGSVDAGLVSVPMPCCRECRQTSKLLSMR